MKRKKRFGIQHAVVFWLALIFVTSCFFIPLEAFVRFVQGLIRIPLFDTWFDRFWSAGWFFVVKGRHATEYAILVSLCAFALQARTQWSRKACLGAAFAFAVLFAATDEWHQTFVPGRDGCVRDVFIDTAGALVAVAWLLANRKRHTAYSDEM